MEPRSLFSEPTSSGWRDIKPEFTSSWDSSRDNYPNSVADAKLYCPQLHFITLTFSFVRPICANLAILVILACSPVTGFPLCSIFHVPTGFMCTFCFLLPQSPLLSIPVCICLPPPSPPMSSHSSLSVRSLLTLWKEAFPPPSSLLSLPPLPRSLAAAVLSFDNLYLPVKMRDAGVCATDQFLHWFSNKR